METSLYNMITAIVAIASLVGTSVLAIITLACESRENRKLHKLTIFSEYTKRYNEIMFKMPEEVFSKDAKLTKETRKYARLYFNLCSEEYYLFEHKLVNEEIWSNWDTGIATRMLSPTLQKEWECLQEEYNKKFRQHMNEIINHNIKST